MSDDKRNLIEQLGAGAADSVLGAMRRGASRRDVIKMLTAAGMQATLAGGLATTAGTVFAQTPKRGGRIRVSGSTAAATDTLDPAKGSNHTDYVRATNFYNGLTELDARLAPRPALAEEWSNDKATTWTFKLRKGVTFHDGKPLTADDVVFSLMRHKDPATASKAKALADQIEEARAVGPNEVRIRLSTPNADFPVMLGTTHFYIVKAGTTVFDGNGTGPFKVKEFKPGVRSIGARNPNYWRSGRPYLDEVEYVGIGDEPARVNALLSGDLDLITFVNARSLARIQQTPGYASFISQSGQYTSLVMRKDMAPGSNADFIQAIKYLQDREQMRKAIYMGHATLGNDQPVDPTNRFYFAGLPQTPYDLDKAKFHFQKSGVGSAALPLVCSPAATSSVDMAVILQQSAQKIGMNIDVKRMPADGYWANHWLKSAFHYGAVNPRPSADTLFTLFFKSDAAWNEARWKNDKFDQLLVAARAETNDDKRKQMYADMQVLVHEQGGIGIPIFMSNIDAHSTKLKGLQALPLGGLMGFSFGEFVWLDA